MQTILQGTKAREKLKEGIDLVSNIIKETLSPKGRNVLINDLSPFPPRSVNDGYLIAQNITHPDSIVDLGATLIKKICQKTNDEAGDGTTSTAILTQVLINEGLKDIEKKWWRKAKNPVDIKREMQTDLIKVVEELKKLSHPIKTKEEIKNIATIAGNNEEEIGEALKEIYQKVGNNASILVEETNRGKMITEAIKGIYFKRGYKEAQAFVNNIRKMTFEHENVKILCVDKTLNNLDDLSPFLFKLMRQLEKENKVSWNLKIVIISDEISTKERILDFLATNNKFALEKKTQQVILPNGQPGQQTVGFICAAIDAPFVGEEQSQILEDIAIATGGTCLTKNLGFTLAEIEPEKILGEAEKVIISRHSTIILGGKANKERMEKRLEMIKAEIEEEKGKVKKEKLQNRLDILTSGVGIIKVSGLTEVERKERLLRVEDAVLAVRAALEEGYCAGGGQTYYQLAKIAKTKYLKKACLAIPRQIALNSGKNPREILKKMEQTGLGYNALINRFENLLETGVIDSTKVIRTALEGAVSFASLFLTTSSAIAEEEKKK